MDLLGILGGKVLEPMENLTEEEKAELKEILVGMGCKVILKMLYIIIEKKLKKVGSGDSEDLKSQVNHIKRPFIKSKLLLLNFKEERIHMSKVSAIEEQRSKWGEK
jgi:hypothetical protein